MNPIGCQNGPEIRRLRKEQLRISGAALAARVGITRQSMSNIELGNKPAGLETLIKIAREFGVRVDDIIKGDNAGLDAEPEGAAA